MGGVVSSTRSSRITGLFSMIFWVVFWSLVILKESFTTYQALLRNRKWEHKLVAFFSVGNGHWVCEWVPCSLRPSGWRFQEPPEDVVALTGCVQMGLNPNQQILSHVSTDLLQFHPKPRSGGRVSPPRGDTGFSKDGKHLHSGLPLLWTLSRCFYFLPPQI